MPAVTSQLRKTASASVYVNIVLLIDIAGRVIVLLTRVAFGGKISFIYCYTLLSFVLFVLLYKAEFPSLGRAPSRGPPSRLCVGPPRGYPALGIGAST
jgi:hypothetical protein